MSEEIHLVSDLALILIAAGIFTLISKALKQPLILGYIVAGFIVGPKLGIFPQLTSTEAVSQWSEIGIIFLLFALGLEFSFKKLLKVGSSALITALTICIGMFVVGMITGKLMSWSSMESVFLGGLLSMSSTTIIIKAYDDLGLKKRPYASLVFGTLVIEDLMAVLLMVLLSTLAASNKFAGGAMLMGIAKLAFFIILWFLVGIFFIPMVLKKAHKYLSDEILLIVAIGLCFVMVALANMVGFSSALGAFVMGSILAETLEGERIARLVTEIKNLFGAIFFVSVGMMVDPQVIGQHWGTVLILALVNVCGILFFSTSGAILSGQGLDSSVHAGFSMAQLGEFAFIIAGVGCSLGVMRDFIYPIIVAVSVLTTFTTPYMIKAADPAYNYLKSHLPKDFVARIDNAMANKTHTAAADNEWNKLIRAYIIRVVLYSVILIAITMGSQMFLSGWLDKLFPSMPDTARSIVATVVTLGVMTPFIIGLAISGSDIARSSDKLLKERDSRTWPVIALAFLRIFIAMGFVLVVIIGHFKLSFWMILFILAAGVVFFFISRKSLSRLSLIEDVFMANLHQREKRAREMAPVASSVSDNLAAFDVHTDIYELPQETVYAGLTLREMPFRHSSGVNIVKIMRGKKNILIPGGSERIYPLDKLLAVGTQSQLAAMRATLAANEVAYEEKESQFELEPIRLTADSFLTGKTLREAEMRSYGCMVISYLRGDKLITNPKPDCCFQEGDIVWVAGEKSACDWWK